MLKEKAQKYFLKALKDEGTRQGSSNPVLLGTLPQFLQQEARDGLSAWMSVKVRHKEREGLAERWVPSDFSTFLQQRHLHPSVSPDTNSTKSNLSGLNDFCAVSEQRESFRRNQAICCLIFNGSFYLFHSPIFFNKLSEGVMLIFVLWITWIIFHQAVCHNPHTLRSNRLMQTACFGI